jgi:hypothetical protein
MAGVAAQREDAGVDQWMERFDTPAQDLREARQLLNAANGNAVLAQQRLGAAGSIPRSASPRAKSTTPVLSNTLISARMFILGAGTPTGHHSSVAQDCSLSSAFSWRTPVMKASRRGY